ncbi:MAG: gamma-glutamyl-gamma-aminobutyrate hydrolase family protein [Myxococcota bacterium]
MMPVVLVTADRRVGTGFAESPRVRPRRDEVYVLEPYVNAVRAAGGTPLVLPPGPTEVDRVLSRVDAVLLTGGDMDIHPSHYGQAVQGRIDRIEPARTELELQLARTVLSRDLPVLGVCGGMQVLAVAAGGTLVQDLPPGDLAHEQPDDPAQPSHSVTLTGRAPTWFGGQRDIQVNSTHHQAVDNPGPFDVVGRAPDGVIEAIELRSHRFAVGVQWHPELIGQHSIYEALVTAAR